jgi:GT2 family glycosyltransferase
MKKAGKSMTRVCVVIPNWNGKDGLKDCLDSLFTQSLKPHVIVVDNGSADGSVAYIEADYPNVEIIKNETNKGYAGGVNPGFVRAQELRAAYVAPFNNDARADKNWLLELVSYLDKHDEVGIVACKLLSADGKSIDSTGECYTTWGLPFPRGRGETKLDAYDSETEIFAASGGASLYRTEMLVKIGLLDEDFFAYYEDVDLSFRAQLAGWKVAYVPAAIAYHQIGATSKRIKGFTTYQTMKNQPLLLVKNVPRKYFWKVFWRFGIAHSLFFVRSITRGNGWIALKGDARATRLLSTAFKKRWAIQSSSIVSPEYIWGMMTHDLPPEAHALKKMRDMFRTKKGKAS